MNDHDAIKKEKENYTPLPVVRKTSSREINNVYWIIKQDVQDIIEFVMEQVLNDPAMEHLVVRKK